MADSVFFANACQNSAVSGRLAAEEGEPALMAWRDQSSYDGLAGEMQVAAHCIAVDDLTIVGCAGPPTLSLSIILDGSFSFELGDGTIIDAPGGSAILYWALAPSTGKDILKPDQHLSLVDFRYGDDQFELVRQTLQCHTRSDCVHHQNGTSSVLVLKAPPRLIELARDVSRFPPGHPLRPLFLQARALEAYIAIISLLNEQKGSCPGFAPNDIVRIERATTLLDQYCGDKWTIPRLARSVGISERKLKRGFKSIKGETIHGYLCDTRIRKAKLMLAQGASVTYVAFAVGFSSPSHFAKCFKRFEGASPSRYAKTLAKVRPGFGSC